MARTKLIRAPLKYVQGKGSLLEFHEETKDLGEMTHSVNMKSLAA